MLLLPLTWVSEVGWGECWNFFGSRSQLRPPVGKFLSPACYEKLETFAFIACFSRYVCTIHISDSHKILEPPIVKRQRGELEKKKEEKKSAFFFWWACLISKLLWEESALAPPPTPHSKAIFLSAKSYLSYLLYKGNCWMLEVGSARLSWRVS